MQEITLWEGSTCPLCDLKGINSKLKFFRLNLRVAALLCKRKQCPFPLNTNYPDTFVRVGQGGKIIPGSQSERGWPDEEEGVSDDSPYISDGSEESVSFPDTVPEVKNLHNEFKSDSTNEKETLEVDAFDINSIDFDTDDSMDTFKLRNEITSLEMEITKCVENMKSIPPQVNCKGSSLHGTNSECKNFGSVTPKAFTSSDDNVCFGTHRELGINDSSCMEMNENGAELYNDRKSGNLILHENDLPVSMSSNLEVSKKSEELANCMQKSEVNTPISNKCTLNYKHTDVQNNSNRHGQDGGRSDNGGGLECVKTNGNSSDNNVKKQLDIFSMPDTSNADPTLLPPQVMNNTTESDLSRDCESHAELVSSESVAFRKDNDCEKEICINKELIIIFDDHKNSDCNDNNAEKELGTISTADTSNSEREPTVLLNPQRMQNTVGNGLPRKCDSHTGLVSIESVPLTKDSDCEKNKCENDETNFIFKDNKNCEVYEIVTIDDDNSRTGFLGDSTNYEVINVGLSVCGNQESSGTIARRKTTKPHLTEGRKATKVHFIAGRKATKLHLRSKNSIKKRGKKSGVACSDSKSVTPSLKLKIVEDDGLFVCTPNHSPSLREVEETTQHQKTCARNKVHSKNCVCFLCKESNKKGITSHLDRVLADLFQEEYTIEKQVTERELPTKGEIMRDFVHYIAGDSSPHNTKRSPKNSRSKRLFHL